MSSPLQYFVVPILLLLYYICIEIIFIIEFKLIKLYINCNNQIKVIENFKNIIKIKDMSRN